jgi:hypothetical protein
MQYNYRASCAGAHLRGDGQAKVSQLQVAAAGYEQVLQLDVPAGQQQMQQIVMRDAFDTE